MVIGLRLVRESNFAEAHAFFDILIEHFPKSGQPWNAKGYAYETASELEQAAAMYARALEVGQANYEDFMLHNYRINLKRVRDLQR